MSEASFQSEIFVAHKNVSFIVKAGNACVLATSTLETKEKKRINNQEVKLRRNYPHLSGASTFQRVL